MWASAYQWCQCQTQLRVVCSANGLDQVLSLKFVHRTAYIVDVDGVRKHFHANKLRKFHVRVDSVTCDSLMILKPEVWIHVLLRMKVITILVSWVRYLPLCHNQNLFCYQVKRLILNQSHIWPKNSKQNCWKYSIAILSASLTYLVMLMLLNTQSHG